MDQIKVQLDIFDKGKKMKCVATRQHVDRIFTPYIIKR